MRRLVDRTVTVVLSAALVVGGLELASYAANGQAFTLGQRNTESRPAALTNTGKGPALSLRARGPALAVGNGRKIVHLNADAVDGRSAAHLETTTMSFVVSPGTVLPFDLQLENVPKGTYLATYTMSFTTGTNPGFCYFRIGLSQTGVSNGSLLSGLATVNDTVLLRKPAGDPLSLICGGADSVAGGGNPTYPSQITLTRVDTVINGALTPQ